MDEHDGMDLYGVLEVSSIAPLEEIRQSYKRLILAHHPDKSVTKDDEPFRVIKFAWDVLSDPERRRKFDESLEAMRIIESRAEKVLLSELTHKEEDIMTRSCRCGDQFEVNMTEYKEMGSDLIQCNGCSLYIKVVGE